MSEQTDHTQGPAGRQASRHLLERLVCPLTYGPLSYDATRQELISLKAGLAYPIREGIPIMIAEDARRMDES